MSNQKETKAQIIGGAVCAALMLVSVAIYLILGITLNLWHPGWLLPACSGIACGIVATVSNTISKLNNLKKETENSEKEGK